MENNQIVDKLVTMKAELSKLSISAKLKPKTFGRKVSEETKAKISLALKNRKK